MNFYQVLTEAVNDFMLNGFDNEERLKYWLLRIRESAEKELIPDNVLEKKLRDSLESAFHRLVTKEGLVNTHVSAFTLAKIKPQLRSELDRRILASANLIKLNREKSVQEVLQRFQGWATSIPVGGNKNTNKIEQKQLIRKSLSKMPFEQRRVIIDQTHKLIANINDIVANQAGAIGARWHSNYRQINYNYRKDHKERDEKIYVIKDGWAYQEGLIKSVDGFTTDITMPGEEVYCFPSDTEIPLINNISKGFRRWYDGELIKLVTTSNKPLRGTPNHPVLTLNGWVNLGGLKKGDYVVEISEKLISSLKENKDYVISIISNIFESLQIIGFTQSSYSSTSEFDGKISQNNIDTVFPNRELMLNGEIEGFEFFKQFNFPNTRVGASFIDSLNNCIKALSGSPERIVSATNSGEPLLWSHLSHTDNISFTSSPDFNSILNKPILESLTTNPQLLRKFEEAFAGLITITQVTNIERLAFSGHVFNLETEHNWYVASTIITHNCRCRYVYLYTLEDFPQEYLTKKGEKALQSKP